MIEQIKTDAKERMLKSVEALRLSLTRLRTGRAHTSLLDHITVDYYGSEVPLNQVGSVNVADARTLTIQPWEKNLIGTIEKAILNSDLGLNPSSSGDVIRVLPPLTEERRRELTKVVRGEAEQARVAVRNIRRDVNQHLKALIKDGSLAKDEEKRAEDEIQKLTNSHIELIEGVLKEKEADLLEM